MPLSWNEIKDRSVSFVREWKDASSEHQDAKEFWIDFLNVFGVSKRRVGSFEYKVKKSDGATGFIDLFWPGVMLAEHKSRGKDLDVAFSQALDYIPGLSDKELPRYVVVSDFARLRLVNLESRESVEFPIEDLPSRLSLFGFIAGYETRTYKEQDPVNIEAAELLAKLHDALKSIGYDGHELEVYLVRVLFCLFADDTGIFMPRGSFEYFIRDRTSEDGSDLAAKLTELFQVLNTAPERRLKNLDEQLTAFPYVNGRLFEENLRVASFDRSMRDVLLSCCDLNWAGISPAIFGSLFQGIMDAKVRRNLGAHYTSEKNILKLIGPLFMDDLRAEFERIKTQKPKLQAFHERLGTLNFFDPACGCGNFLVISYREIRLLELEVIAALYGKEAQQLSMDVVSQYVKVDVDQFHGIEIEEWPAQIARVAMWLIDHQMNLRVGEAFGQAIVRVPLVKSANIVHGNALRIDWNAFLPAERCSYVLGNPPFSGAMVMDDNARVDRANVLSDIPGSGVLDFVSCWYWLAAKYIQKTSIKVGLVSTNSITQGEQVSLLWLPMLNQYGIVINFAHRTFRWSNEARGVAAVHCVIIGFSCNPSQKCSIFEYEDVRSEPLVVSASTINPYLIDAPNHFVVNRSVPACDVPAMRFGNMPRDGGNLILSDDEKLELLSREPGAASWVKRYMGADEFLNGDTRWCLWLKEAPPHVLKDLPLVRARVEATRSFRLKSKAESTRRFAATPALFCQVSQPETTYLLVPSVSSEKRSYIPIGFFPPDVITSNSAFVVPDATAHHFGVLTSTMHMAWVRTVCGRLESRYRYSKDIVYNNFPWPIDASEAQREAIATAAQGVLDARASFPDSTLADLYDPLSMPAALVKAHQALDRAVDAAYVSSGGKRTWSTEAERVAFLFEMYQRLTSLLPAEGGSSAKRKSKGRATPVD